MTWIWFKEPRVWRFLIEQGYVYTLRSLSRPRGIAYTKPENRKCVVNLAAAPASSANLARYLSGSGFLSLEEWREAALKLHGQLDNLGVFRVDLL
jgi:hypothetical protein